MYALQHFYLPSPIHSRFINQKVLQRYLPVGGVRIEDDVLITSRGYENLTTAPKGTAMLDIIRGKGSNTKSVTRPTTSLRKEHERPVFRAPGISLQRTTAGLCQLTRAETMPKQPVQGYSQEEPRDRQECSLGLRRTMTTDERIQYWRESCQRSPHSELPPVQATKLATVCGFSSSDVKHTYIGEASTFPREVELSPNCTQCMLLVHALDRLRQNLSRSEQGSPRSPQEPHPQSGPACNMPLPRTSSPAATTKHNAKGTACAILEKEFEGASNPCKQSATQNTLLSEEEPARNDATIVKPSALLGLRPSVCLAAEAQQDPYGFMDARDPETFYRPTPFVQSSTRLTRADPTSNPLLPNVAGLATTIRIPKGVSIPRLADPLQARKPLPKEQRRPSNHTDDRDWMA
jgi:Xaa-Pro dipeptidase